MRRRGAVPALVLTLALVPGCGLRVSKDTRQALLQHELSTGTTVTSTGGTTDPLAGAGTSGSGGTGTGGATGSTGTTGTTGSTGAVGSTGASSRSGSTGRASTTGGSVATPPAGGNGGATDIGVTATSLTVGTVADKTGPRPGLFDGTIAGVRAYFAYINSQGGVYGRKLDIKVGDSGTACNATADVTRSLVDKVFAFVGSFGVYDNCAAPVFNENPKISDVSYAISRERNAVKNNFSVQPQPPGAQTGPAVVFKQRFPGIQKKLGALIADVAASRSAWDNLKVMYKSEGYDLIYEQFVSPTEVDFTRFVIGMRNAGVDMVVLTNDIAGEVKFVNAAQQQSWTPHVITTRAVFYDPSFKDLVSGSPTNVYAELGSALYFNRDERGNPGVALIQDWMAKSAPDVPIDSFVVFGWSQAKLFVDALTKAGPRATRTSLLTSLQSTHTVDTGGLLPSGDPGAKKPNACFIIAHWERAWKRYSSPASGFDCAKPYYLQR